MGIGLNAGSLVNGFDLNDQEQGQAVQNVQAQSAAAPQPTNAQVSQAATSASGWDTTQKYMGAVNSLGGEDGEQKNGLGKVLGLVGLFA